MVDVAVWRRIDERQVERVHRVATGVWQRSGKPPRQLRGHQEARHAAGTVRFTCASRAA